MARRPAVAADGRYAFPGDAAGRISRHRLTDREGGEALTCHAFPSDGATGPRRNVVCLDVVDDNVGEGAQLVVAACDFPAAAAGLRFRGTAASVLWHERRMTDNAVA